MRSLSATFSTHSFSQKFGEEYIQTVWYIACSKFANINDNTIAKFNFANISETYTCTYTSDQNLIFSKFFKLYIHVLHSFLLFTCSN